MGPANVRKSIDVGGNQVMGRYAGNGSEPAEPKGGHSGEEFAFPRNSVRKNDVEGRKPIGRDEKEGVAEVVDIPNLAPPGRRKPGEVRDEKRRRLNFGSAQVIFPE